MLFAFSFDASSSIIFELKKDLKGTQTYVHRVIFRVHKNISSLKLTPPHPLKHYFFSIIRQVNTTEQFVCVSDGVDMMHYMTNLIDTNTDI